MQLRNILVAASLSAVATVSFAKGSKEPNCEVNGKKTHVKDEKACTKKKGTWAAGGSMAPAPAAAGEPAAAPAAHDAGAAPAPAEGGAAK